MAQPGTVKGTACGWTQHCKSARTTSMKIERRNKTVQYSAVCTIVACICTMLAPACVLAAACAALRPRYVHVHSIHRMYLVCTSLHTSTYITGRCYWQPAPTGSNRLQPAPTLSTFNRFRPPRFHRSRPGPTTTPPGHSRTLSATLCHSSVFFFHSTPSAAVHTWQYVLQAAAGSRLLPPAPAGHSSAAPVSLSFPASCHSNLHPPTRCAEGSAGVRPSAPSSPSGQQAPAGPSPQRPVLLVVVVGQPLAIIGPPASTWPCVRWAQKALYGLLGDARIGSPTVVHCAAFPCLVLISLNQVDELKISPQAHNVLRSCYTQ